MNIQEALDRLQSLKESIAEAENLVSLLSRRNHAAPQEVTVYVFNAMANDYCGHQDRVLIHADLLLEVVQKAITLHKAELAKLQPVIDMAEAAILGVFAQEEMHAPRTPDPEI